MGAKRSKVLAFNFGIALLVWAVHQDTVSQVLDDAVGFRWAEGLVLFLRANSSGLIVLILLSLFFEFARYDELKEYLKRRSEQANEGLADLLAQQNPRELVRYAIASFHGVPTADVGTLVNLVAPPVPMFRGASMDVTLRRHDKDFYYYDADLRFTVNQDEVVFAVTNRTIVVEGLLSRVPSMIEAWSHHDGRDLSSLASVGEYAKLVEHVKHPDGTLSDRTLPLVRVPARRLASYYSDGVPLAPQDVALFSHRFREGQAGMQRQVSLHLYSQCPISDNYTYWLAPRGMFLHRLTFDTSDLLVGSPDLQFSLHPCLGLHRTTDASDEARGRMTLNVNSWVVRGQGAFVTWKPAPEGGVKSPAGAQEATVAEN